MTAETKLVERLLAVVEKGRVDANSIYGDAAVLAYQAADAIERLTAELAIARCSEAGPFQLYVDKLKADLAAMTAERDALKKDAERLPDERDRSIALGLELKGALDAALKDARKCPQCEWTSRHRHDCEIRGAHTCTCDFFTKGGELSPALVAELYPPDAALAAQEKP